jgi:hypothetical protein
VTSRRLKSEPTRPDRAGGIAATVAPAAMISFRHRVWLAGGGPGNLIGTARLVQMTTLLDDPAVLADLANRAGQAHIGST